MKIDLQIEACRSIELSATDQQAIHEVDAAAYAGQDGGGYQWATGDWYVIGRQSGRIVCQLGIVDRQALVGKTTVRLGGIGGVATLPELQGRGLGSAVLKFAGEYMHKTMGVDFGLLVCETAMVPFYEKLGWLLVKEPMVFDQPGSKVTWHEETMILPCRQINFPAGIIDLCGLPW